MGCELYAFLVRPHNWPGHHWRHKGGQKVALVAQGWHKGRSYLAMVVVKFWACSKQSHKGRQRGQSLTDRSKEAGGRRTHHRVVVEWVQNAVGHWSPHKKAYHCKHCVPIWTMLLPSLYHHYASFGRPIASVERSLWWPLCLHSATTSNLEPPWQSFCLHSASLVQSVLRLLQFWWVKEGTRVVLQQLHRNRTFLVWATTEHPDHLSGCSKVARRSRHCVKGT